MLSSKQRAYLRGLASNMSSIIHIGKLGVSPELTKAVEEALIARELVKIDILNNCSLSVKEVAEIISGRTRSEVVQIIGGKIVLYKKPKEGRKAVIELK